MYDIFLNIATIAAIFAILASTLIIALKKDTRGGYAIAVLIVVAIAGILLGALVCEATGI